VSTLTPPVGAGGVLALPTPAGPAEKLPPVAAAEEPASVVNV
jgi:hypothetical protein